MVSFSNIFPGGAAFARTQHASRKWEWRFRAEVDTWQGLGDAPGSLAISACHTESSRLIGDLSLLWSRLVGVVQQPRSNAAA